MENDFESPQIDFPALWKTISGKPKKWKMEQMKIFLNTVKLDELFVYFEKSKMTGKKYLKLSPEDEFWENEINNKDKQLLLEYQKLLLKYEKKLSKNEKVEEGTLFDKKKEKKLDISDDEEPEPTILRQLPEKSGKIINKEEEKKEDESDSENGETIRNSENKKNSFGKKKTIPVKKKEPTDVEIFKLKESQKFQQNDDEDDKNGTIAQNSRTIEKIIQEIQILLIPPSDDTKFSYEIDKSFHFVTDFTLNRNKELSSSKDNIFLNDTKISREHASVIFLKNRGFFLQDKGSSNHTYLRINEKSRTLLEEGMEILFANSLFKILEINKNCLNIEATPKYMIKEESNNPLQIALKAKSKLVFGTNPKKKDLDDEAYEFKLDETIEKTHAIFHFISDKIYLEPTKTLFGSWIKLGNRKKESDLYLLMPKSEIRLGNFKVIVEKSFALKQEICEICKINFVDSVFLPCKDSQYCFSCAMKKEQKCPCGESNAVKKLIFLFSDF